MADNITFDDGYNQTSFLDGLQYTPNAVLGNDIPITGLPAGYYASNNLTALPTSILPYKLATEFPGQTPRTTAEDFDGFLAQYSLPNTPGAVIPTKTFTSLSGLASAWYVDFMHESSSKDGLYNSLLQEFTSALNIQIDSSGNVTGGDWQILTGTPAVSPAVNFSASSANNPFIRAFNNFLSTYTYPQSPLSGDLAYYKNFLDQWHSYLSNISLLNTPDSSTPANFQNLISYEAIYKAYAKDPSDEAFKIRLKQFYQEEMSSKGYFMPSQSLTDWVTAIRNENNVNMNLELIGSSLAGNSSEKALVLNRIILLLISLIKTLQDVGIAQANRLTYLTKYQNVYTALQTQIPVFLKDGSNPLGGSSTEAGQTRNDLNSSFNGILTDNLRSLRGIQEDNAKKLQSKVNSTNDAVNQQTDMVSTFIQQMQTLLNAILR
ncbi:hypothetical protein [Candidatus Protochlamydia sp. W-9]|uniref:hypothetical protein n=1 Tax=Candidatus Protochlamydia sp. W-9 TaxID=1785087 RepID=UPI00096A9531|nr:hypothetical protein [Candidatus Protochlamydia sp. W-9]